MFYAIIAIVAVLGLFAYLQGSRAAKKAHAAKLEAIRKKIEENEKKKLLSKLEGKDQKRKELSSTLPSRSEEPPKTGGREN